MVSRSFRARRTHPHSHISLTLPHIGQATNTSHINPLTQLPLCTLQANPHSPPPPNFVGKKPSNPKKRRTGDEAIAEIITMATRLDLVGPLGIDFGIDATHPGGSLEASLFSSLHARCSKAWDVPRLLSALKWFAGFNTATTRIHFIPAFGENAMRGYVHNRCTADLFGEFIVRSPPMRGSAEHVGADAASGYVGAILTLRSREARYCICPAEVNLNAPLAFKTIRRSQGPPGDRKLSRGIRAIDLSKASRTFPRTSIQDHIDWAAALLAHNAYLRGGEIGIPDNAEVDPKRIITFDSLVWHDPRPESHNRMWLIVWIVPIKDPKARHKAYPTPICRRHDGPFGNDPLDTYDAIAQAHWSRRRPGIPFPVDRSGTPLCEWWLQAEDSPGTPSADSPFFTAPSGEVYTTSDTRRLGRSIARHAGIPPENVGAKCFRVGGSTDARSRLGETGKSLIKQRGRWSSDVAEIYQRPLLHDHLEASAAVGQTTANIDLEAVCEGWAQPTFR